MIDRIHVPAFFEKLAANGMTPRNDAEAQQLLQLGAVLAQAEADGRTKQAQDENNPFLTHVLAGLQAQQQPDADALVKQSADQMIGESDYATTAASVYAHVASGGELAEANEQPEE